MAKNYAKLGKFSLLCLNDQILQNNLAIWSHFLCVSCRWIFKNGPTPASFCLFSVFSIKQYNFYNTWMWKNISCPSCIWRGDLNPRPLEHQLSPITTIPELPPYCRWIFVGVSSRHMRVCLFKPRAFDHTHHLLSLQKVSKASVSFRQNGKPKNILFDGAISGRSLPL